MAFTFNATASSSSANSYGTVEEADDYFSSFLYNDDWSSLSTEQKQKLLVMATRRLDVERYYGLRTVESQNLEFPRYYLVDWQGLPIGEAEVPTKLKEAQFELAYYLLQNQSRNPTETSDFGDPVSFSLGGTISVSYGKNNNLDQLPDVVIQLLRNIGPQIWKHKTRNRRLVM